MGIWKYIFGLLTLFLISIWLAVFNKEEGLLHLIACDVGQGDAILAVYEDIQILVDGGPNSRVLDCLSDNLSYFDKEIELVILTHPQFDHYRGLIDVFENYEVKYFLANSLDSGSQEYEVLKNAAMTNQAQIINPKSNMVVRLGKIQLDIVWPTEEFVSKVASDTNKTSVLGSFTAKRDPNDFSVVAILRLGKFDALLTGDIGPEMTDDLLLTGKISDVEYIKVPHHGSKNGLIKELLEASTPEIAVISVGKNQWGHPHQEVLNLLKEFNVETKITKEEGEIELITDGEKIWFE